MLWKEKHELVLFKTNAQVHHNQIPNEKLCSNFYCRIV